MRLTLAALLLHLLVSAPSCKGHDGPLTFDMAPVSEHSLEVVVNDESRMFIEHPPIIVAGGSEDFVYRDRLEVALGGRFIHEVFVFHGIDEGDRVEMDTELYLDEIPVYLRSGHGPKDDDDAWDQKHVDRAGQLLTVAVLCRVSGVNTVLNRVAARPHWGIWVTFERRPRFP